MTNQTWSREDYWLAHLRNWNNIQLFPRDYGLYRTEVYKKEYLFLLSSQYDKMNCYAGVYSNRQIEENIYDTLFLEAREVSQDTKVNLDDVIADRDMLRAIFERHGIGCRFPYSGGRSYHFYLDFPPMFVSNLSAMARNFVYDLDIVDLLDMHTVGNKRSMSRIVHTYNEKHGKYSIYSMADDANVLEEEAILGSMKIPPVRELIETDILKYLKVEEAEYRMELLKPAKIAFNGTYPDCVLNIMSKLAMEHHATHNERIHLTAYLHRFGHSVEEIVNSFRDASDFVPSIAEGQVLGLISSNYNPFSCKRVKKEMHDICPFSDKKGYCHYIKSALSKRKDLEQTKNV